MAVMQSVFAAVLVLAAAMAVQDVARPREIIGAGPRRGGIPESRTETRHLTIETSTSAPAVAAGKRVSLLVDVTPKPKMHVYAPGQDGYITISLTLAPNAAFTAGKTTYPAGEKILMAILKETQIVYAKPFRIAQDISLRPGSGEGSAPVIVKGTVRYQACDDTICYLPANVPVEWTVEVPRAR